MDRRLATLRTGHSIDPAGQDMMPARDAAEGDHPSSDGRIGLHTGTRIIRDATLAILSVEPVREQVATAVSVRHRTPTTSRQPACTGDCP